MKIHVEADIKPRFFRPCPMPYVLRSKLEGELYRLLKECVIEPVQFKELATPLVTVLKQDGSLRLCGDYRVIVNQCAKLEEYPLCRGLVCSIGWGNDLHKTGLGKCIPAACTG